MSYWVHLEDRTATPWCSYGKEPSDALEREYGVCPEPCYPAVQVEQHSEGGTYRVGGTDEAELNVTYNYGGRFREAWEAVGGQFGGIGDGTLGKMIGEKRAADVLPFLKAAVERLGTQPDADYWQPTEGNAGRALAILASWAEQHPDAVFRVS